MKVIRRGDWLSARVGDELVMMSAETGKYVGLSDVGARIWELLETHADLDSLCAALEAEFDIAPDVCRKEVEDFVVELQAQNAVALDPAPEAKQALQG